MDGRILAKKKQSKINVSFVQFCYQLTCGLKVITETVFVNMEESWDSILFWRLEGKLYGNYTKQGIHFGLGGFPY